MPICFTMDSGRYVLQGVMARGWWHGNQRAGVLCRTGLLRGLSGQGEREKVRFELGWVNQDLVLVLTFGGRPSG